MRLSIGKPIKVAGEKWLLDDVLFECEGQLTTVTLKLSPYLKGSIIPPRKQWTIYVDDEDNPIDPVSQVVEEAVALIEGLKAELREIEVKRRFNRAQDRLRRRSNRDSLR